MKLFLRDQEAALGDYVAEFREKKLALTDLGRLPSRTLRGCALAAARDLRQCKLEFLFAYDIFPLAILSFLGEWQLEGRSMREGDVIVQQAQVPPRWGVRLVFGVRVLSVYCEKTRAGFSYGTLIGHPETGMNEFSFVVIDAGIVASVHTVAAPALPLPRLLAPVFTNRYIAFCNQQALRRMEEKFRQSN